MIWRNEEYITQGATKSELDFVAFDWDYVLKTSLLISREEGIWKTF